MVLGLHRLGILLLSVRIRAPDMLRLHGLQVRRQQELGSCLGCTLVNTPQIAHFSLNVALEQRDSVFPSEPLL
jgi:hypothetical protein